MPIHDCIHGADSDAKRRELTPAFPKPLIFLIAARRQQSNANAPSHVSPATCHRPAVS